MNFAQEAPNLMKVCARTPPMSIAAVSGMTGVGPVQPDRPSVPAADQKPAAPSAAQISTGTYPPLSPSVLAMLIGQPLTLYGSFN
jgi:hypothetical protein